MIVSFASACCSQLAQPPLLGLLNTVDPDKAFVAWPIIGVTTIELA
jgi:hypothetical protein